MCSGVQFFNIATSKSGPSMQCFVHFDLKMCFSLQRRAIFPHLNFKKWPETVSFLTFWLQNVLLATAACNFSTSQLQKVVRTCSERHILIENVLLATAACNFSTSQLQKVVRACSERHILIENVLLATAACNFSTSQLQKVVRACSERHILIENVLLATAACNFSFPSWKATSAPAALARLLFDPADPQIIEKHSISWLL